MTIDDKIKIFYQAIDDGWSVSVSRTKAKISDKLHHDLFFMNLEYKQKVLTYYKKHGRGSAYLK
jgi:hypothetical protein